MPTDRLGLTILTVDECVRLLETHHVHVGRVAFVDGGYPVVLPVNYRFVDGAVVLRTASGSKLGKAFVNAQVAFEVDAVDPSWEEGWSVLVQGVAEEVLDPDELQRLQALPLRPWAPGTKPHFVRIWPSHISGRRIQ